MQSVALTFRSYQVSLQSTNQPSISVEENITIYGCGSSLGYVTKIIQQNFCFSDILLRQLNQICSLENVHKVFPRFNLVT